MQLKETLLPLMPLMSNDRSDDPDNADPDFMHRRLREF
jgi:hypothetical protein